MAAAVVITQEVLLRQVAVVPVVMLRVKRVSEAVHQLVAAAVVLAAAAQPVRVMKMAQQAQHLPVVMVVMMTVRRVAQATVAQMVVVKAVI